MGWNLLQIEARHERYSIHRAESRSSTRTHVGTSLAGRALNVIRNPDWHTTWYRDRTPSEAEQTSAGERQHYSNDSQSRTLWISAARAVAWRTCRPACDSGPDSVRVAAYYSKHVHGNS